MLNFLEFLECLGLNYSGWCGLLRRLLDFLSYLRKCSFCLLLLRFDRDVLLSEIGGIFGQVFGFVSCLVLCIVVFRLYVLNGQIVQMFLYTS